MYNKNNETNNLKKQYEFNIILKFNNVKIQIELFEHSRNFDKYIKN